MAWSCSLIALGKKGIENALTFGAVTGQVHSLRNHLSHHYIFTMSNRHETAFMRIKAKKESKAR
jgi:hypothetical protein